MDKVKTILVTGGMGFMGSHLVEHLSKLETIAKVVVVDCFTYAARNVKFPQYVYIERCDIRDHWALSKVFEKHKPDLVYHLAAESHVCRSIEGPRDFVTTNIIGTWHVAEECRKHKVRMVHVSTDEVFGEVKQKAKGRRSSYYSAFTENTHYAPRSPYAASKASGDHLVQCYSHTYGLDSIIIHPSNNFGPNQHEEKLIPRTITRILTESAVVIYGRGDHRREWLHVDDFVQGITTLAVKGRAGDSFCIGGGFECSNLEMVNLIYSVINELWPKRYQLKIIKTDDRPTDDKAYAMISTKAKALGFKPQPKLMRERLRSTVLWYFERIELGAKDQAVGAQG